MDSLKVNSTNVPNIPKYFQKAIVGMFLVGFILLIFYGYCYGWWGRNSLFLQYVFQCGCPSASDEMRLPNGVDVVVPACPKNAMIRLSPSGRLLFVGKKNLLDGGNYILNLETGEITYIPILSEGSIHFLNDEIIFHTFYGIDEYLFDWRQQSQYPVEKLNRVYSDAYLDGYVNLEVLAQVLKDYGDVFLIGDDVLVAVDSDFHVSSEKNFFIDRFDILGHSFGPVEEFLLTRNIHFVHIPVYPEYLPEVASPGDAFIARDDGIYLAESNQKIVEGYPGVEPQRGNGSYFSLFGWVYDGSGAIYGRTHGSCLFAYWLPYMDGSKCVIRVPQPVLKLKVPEEYLDERTS